MNQQIHLPTLRLHGCRCLCCELPDAAHHHAHARHSLWRLRRCNECLQGSSQRRLLLRHLWRCYAHYLLKVKEHKTLTHTAYLSLGTNLGDKENNLLSAISEIERRIGPVRAQSAFLATEPWGFDSQNTFLNAAIRIETKFSPHELLDETQQIERDLGRKHKSVNGQYHDRIIDIDILLYDDLHISTPRLTIPHPHMHERDFVIIPLKEIIQ